MNYNLLWIFLLILQTFTASLPIPNQYDTEVIGINQEPMTSSPKEPRHEHLSDSSDEKVISVRITSSVAIGRRRDKSPHRHPEDMIDHEFKNTQSKVIPSADTKPAKSMSDIEEMTQLLSTNIPPNLVGANIEYLKQLSAKKESKEHNLDPVHPFQLMVKGQHQSDDVSSQKETEAKIDEYGDDIQDIPLARKIPSTADSNKFYDQKAIHLFRSPNVNLSPEGYNFSATNDTSFGPLTNLKLNANKNITILDQPIVNLRTNTKESRYMDQSSRIDTFDSNNNNYQSDDSVAEYSIKSVEFTKYNDRDEIRPPQATRLPVRALNDIQGFTNRPLDEERNNPRLTTVSFNIVHDTPKTSLDNVPDNSYISSSQIVSNQKQFYDPPKIYSQPAQVYSEPAKFYSEPAKIYSEPAKIYSEPAKVYSEPAKIYSEPSKFYSEPASLHLDQNVPSSAAPNYSPWLSHQRMFDSTPINTTPVSTVTSGLQPENTNEQQPERNYEVDEKISVLTDGRSHGVQQDTSTEKCKQENCKVGYVVEGRQFKKYRVEERTPDGFIVGEYGVVRNEDGALRGVRYTADSDASPRLIHDALMKFLQLK